MNKELQKFYKDKYKLKKLNINISNKPIVSIIYDDNANYYFYNNELIEITTNDILNEINNLNNTYKLKITNFYPICYCNNTLVIAFRSSDVSSINLQKISKDNIPEIYECLVNFHQKNYSNIFSVSNITNEIKMSEKYIGRYKFHDNFIKKYILTSKKRRKKEFNKILSDLVPYGNSIIDISCGDNDDLFKVANEKNYKLIVGNDLCLSYLNINQKNNKKLIYTNDNIKCNNIKENSYDVSFCKNTLHHLNDYKEMSNAFKLLDRISNEIIIVEILDPKQTKGLPKFLNKHLYINFLKDVGNNYLNEVQIKELVNKTFIKHNIEYKKFTNILGDYIIIKIKKRV